MINDNYQRYVIGSRMPDLEKDNDALVRQHYMRMFQDLIQTIPDPTKIQRIDFDVIEDKFAIEIIMEAIIRCGIES